ncbi:Aste57867_22536 [Aphanomyces stellatus]|uniref:Aste57867_22536 protein n=1 Tax=Aphanomyces stellatus TaxID=120398 RepID=A0A485LL70_9STRA|nr:hypothetical protein As57867_022466 [Aphanomyces stellatus]VFT99196.1 Aste57867_22536 [Aphanomyces stellatus]
MQLSRILLLLSSSLAAAEVLLSVPIQINGNAMNLEFSRGQTYERAALSFMESHNLLGDGIESASSQTVLAQLASVLRERDVPKQIIVNVPVTIENTEATLTLFQDEAVEDAVLRFLQNVPLTEDDKVQAHPQLLEILRAKVAEATAPREPLFTLELTFDDQPVAVQHFDGADPFVEARAFAASLGITNEGVLENVVPAVAAAIQKRIDDLRVPNKELVSVPLTVNDQTVMLVHFEGSTPTQSAMTFLQQNGITDAATINAYLPTLVELIDNQVALRAQEATQETSPPRREPMVSFPLSVNGVDQVCEYFEGDSPDVTSQLFLEAHGMTNDPNYAAYVEKISNLIRQRANDVLAAKAAATPREPLFTLPLLLANQNFDLAYFAEDDPAAVATQFCNAQINALAVGLDHKITNADLEQCKVYLFQTITKILDQSATEQVVETAPTQAEAPTHALLFTLDIDLGDGKSVALPFHQGDDAVLVATQFCERNGIDADNVQLLVDEIGNQLATL